MFQRPTSRRRLLGSRSNRRAAKLHSTLRQRQLAVETLESRQMLSATSPSSGAMPFGLPVAQAHSETLRVKGAPFEFIADPTPVPAATVHTSAQLSTAAANGALHPLTDIPILHSDPSARVKLYLDFDGLSGSGVNDTPVYDRDGDLTTFSDTELNNMYVIWSRTAEDYAPFNVDVTTEQPPELAPGVPDSVANGVALRVAIGGDGSWTGGVYGGVANVGCFTGSAANTVYVFSANFGSPWEYWVADAASHEAGHGFGLAHQSTYDANGNKTNEYNPGDSTTWAPIMGYNYVPVTTWYNGTSTSATTVQDDMAILAGSANGFGYRADDHGDSLATADPLAFDGSTFTGSGIIGTNSDVDVWSFTVSTQDTYRLHVDPATFGPNLDAVLMLRDAAGSLIASASPATSQAADLLLSLTPATYYLAVTKTAAYGWLGAYTVNITTVPAGVTVSAAEPIVTRESGGADSFTVVLESQPTADVTIPVSSSNTNEGTLSTASLVFTPDNWNVPQTVTVSGVADGVRDGDVNYSIVFGKAVSADLEYDGFQLADLSAVNLDDSSTGFLYWVDSGNEAIQRSELDGSNPQTIVDLKALFGTTTDYGLRYLAVDAPAGKMYWTDSGPGRIQRANLDGSNVETLISGFTGGGLRGIAIDSAAGKLYWADFSAGKIQCANLDGSGIQDLITSGVTGVREIALDVAAGKLYFAGYTSHDVRRANLDGSNVEVLWSGDTTSTPAGLTLDTAAGKMYWSDTGTDRIYRADLNGSNVEQLLDTSAFSTGSTIGSLAIDLAAGRLYFSDVANKTLHRANLDGSNLVAIATAGLSSPQGISLLRPSIAVTPNSGLLTSESGGSAAFKVSLNTPPTADVTIPISSSNPQEGAATQTSVTFTPSNWNIPQIVTVVGVDDHMVDGNQPYSILLGPAASADSDYTGLDPRDVSLTNVENITKYLAIDDAATDRGYRYLTNGSFDSATTLAPANSAPRGVTTSAGSNKTWVIDANRTVYVYDTNGTLLGSWTAGTLASNATPQGIATNGTDIWIVDARSDKVYRYASAASRLSGSQSAASSFSLNSGNLDATDLVTDGTSLWVTNNNTIDKVFKYSLSGTLQGSWTMDAANSTPVGIALDPANASNLLIADSGTDRVYQYTGAATRTSGSQSASSSFVLAAGNANAKGIVAVVTSSGNLVPADVAVSSSAASTATEGNVVTFTFNVTNNGPAAATGVVLTDTLGANWTYSSASNSQGTVQQAGGVVTINIGSVAAGQVVTVQVQATALEPGVSSNTAALAATTSDFDSGNNSTFNVVSVAAAPIVVSGSPRTVTGKQQSNITTATFTHAGGIHAANYYAATIHWGDGTSSAGTISKSGSVYTVKGSHNYTGSGSHTVTTTVARVSAAPLPATTAGPLPLNSTPRVVGPWEPRSIKLPSGGVAPAAVRGTLLDRWDTSNYSPPSLLNRGIVDQLLDGWQSTRTADSCDAFGLANANRDRESNEALETAFASVACVM